MVNFDPYYSHTIPISLGIQKSEWYGKSMGKGSHYWVSLKIPLKKGHKCLFRVHFKGMKYGTQLCRDCNINHEIGIPIQQPVFHGK